MTLTEFLLARIAENEAVAREAASIAGTPWRATYGRQVETSRDGYLVTPEDEHSDLDDPADAVSQHIARHDPVRVLAECEAKRRIVQEYTDLLKWDADESDDHGIHGQRIGLEFAVKMLALPDTDHPDYKESWRP